MLSDEDEDDDDDDDFPQVINAYRSHFTATGRGIVRTTVTRFSMINLIMAMMTMMNHHDDHDDDHNHER